MNALGCRRSGVSASGQTLSKLDSLTDDYSIDEALKYLLSCIAHIKQVRVKAVRSDGDALRSALERAFRVYSD